jgi:hypothetical protein
MKCKIIYFFILCVVSISFAANFPFPQNKVMYGIKTTTDVSADVESAYQSWLSGYYEEQDSLARIDWDTKSQTVSEGIGYGMLIMVCMDNSQNNTRTKFDKLWRYYKKFRNSNGVMNWKIDGFSGVSGDGKNGATDAELDAATALVLAYRQWADQTYLKDAQTLINAIWTHEVNANKYLKPGDAWDTKKDPSYFSTGGMELFKSVDSRDWSTVMANSFTLQLLYMLLMSGNFSLVTGIMSSVHPLVHAVALVDPRSAAVIANALAGRCFSLTGKKLAGPGAVAMQPLIRMR